MRESSRGGVPFGVVEKKELLLGNTILLGRERERLDRWNDDREKRRFFLSSLGLSVSAECVIALSGVVVVDAIVRDVGPMNSGSSEASREDGIESVRE